MALVKRSDLMSMDCSYLGEPFVWVTANPLDDLMGMDKSYLGSPFVTNGGVVYHRVIRVSWGNVNKFLGVNSIKSNKIVGVSTI
ncbi:MAG: hypothetical protein WC238_04610 [Parcubacteria group bacterium]|jgi:hypothetical protein